VEHYRPQVELYCRFWERLTAEKVKEAGLYFTSIDVWKRLR
jgi:ATP-dependent helicase/nuclease subunit A